MSYYSLAMPTLVFVIALAQMGLPSALSKVISISTKKVNVILSAIMISLITNFILIGIFILLIPLLSMLIFKRVEMQPILYSMLYMVPMVSLSGILKGTLQGLQMHVSSCISQVFEEIFRIIYLFFVFQSAMNDIELARVAMFSVFIGEIGSSLYMLIVLLLTHWNVKIRKPMLPFSSIAELLSLSIPMSASRFIGSFTYFLEPFIFLSFSSHEIYALTYGTLNGYVLPLITMSSFISLTLASALLPSFTYETHHKHYKRAMKIFWTILSVSFFISSIVSFVCFLFPHQLLNFMYHTDEAASLLKLLSIPFVFYALQPILSSMLHALNQSKKALFDTVSGCILRLLLLFLTPIFKHHTLLLAMTCSMLLTTLMHAYNTHQAIKMIDLSSNT